MKQQHKTLLCIFLFVIVGVVWWPKGREPKSAKAKSHKNVTHNQVPVQSENSSQSQRTSFQDYGRNPFMWSNIKPTDAPKDSLKAIMRSPQGACAIINDLMVRTGDKVGGKTVQEINRDGVVLTDGVQEYRLQLKH